MITQIRKKVRLVRCPRCGQVLAELPDVTLYKCGGCGTILQAKTRKMETNHSELSSQVTDPVAKTQQDNVSEKKEARSSNHDLSSPSKGDSFPDKDNISYQDEHGDSRMELCEDRSVPSCLCTSPVVNCHETENSPIGVEEPLKHDESKSSLDQNSKSHDGTFHDCDGKWTGSRNFSDESPCSRKFIYHEAEESPLEASEHVGDNFINRVQNLPENDDQENDVLPGGGEHREGTKDKCVSLENEGKSQTCSANQNRGFCGEIRHAGEETSSGGIVSHKNGNASQSAKTSIKVDDSIEGLSTFRRPSTEKNLSASVEGSTVASQSALKGSIVSVNFTSPDDENLDHCMRKFSRNFGSTSSVDTMGSSPLADPSSELSVKRGDMTNSPTRSYYAYDGSESSYDGDQSLEHISHPSRRKSKDVDHISTTVMLKKDGYRVNDMLNSETEMNYWAPNSSFLQGKDHHAMKCSHLNQDEFTKTKRHSHASGNRMRLGKEGCVSRSPFTSSDLPADKRTGNPSIYRHDLLRPHPRSHLPDNPSYSEPDKMDLLRTVCELKDQLNRIQFPKVASNGRFPAGVMEEKWDPYYYDGLTPEREIYADLNHPGYHLQHNQAKNWTDQCNVSRMAFSGEAARYRHQVNCSCLHCCPQDWHRSAQFPSHYMHCKNVHCMVHNGYNHCNISSSSSPQHYTSSELSLWGHEIQPDNQRLRDHEMKRLLREKYHTAKRHLRPIAGGAPVVPCYHCSELLQLPADFLLFKKRYHQLRCGACRKVLKFSLLKSKHIVPYLPNASAPPPSDAGNYSDAIHQRNLLPISHSNSCQYVEPVNDDYGRSFSRTCSTEGDASIMPSSDLIERNTYSRRMSSVSSYDPMEDRRMKSILKESQNKNNGLAETFESIGPSSKVAKLNKTSSEIENLPTSTNSPLHRLMGYASARYVLNK
ncbi:hypothetical protein Pfo_027640 [Paulownia fortunei]|nr:hypothetical protein Pfo_027640 [Paulownia fortunei]